MNAPWFDGVAPVLMEEEAGEGRGEHRTPMDGEHSDSFLSRMYAYIRSGRRPDTLDEETERMAKFATFFSLRRSYDVPGQTKTEKCLRICIRRMHEKHSMVFGGLMVRLNIDRNINFYEGFLEVSEELFKEEVNWSKIVALYAFGARLAQYCEDNDMEELLNDLSESLARFSKERLSTYIKSQGGWESLCDAFPVDNDVELKMRQALCLLAVGFASASVYLVFRTR